MQKTNFQQLTKLIMPSKCTKQQWNEKHFKVLDTIQALWTSFLPNLTFARSSCGIFLTSTCTFLHKPFDFCADPIRPRQTSAFLPLLTSSVLTKIGIMYAQLLQEEKIFPIDPNQSDRPNGACDMHKKLMLKKLSGKLRAKFPAPTSGYSMVKTACLKDTFLEVF